jgi:hypothetical protein
MKPKSWNTPFIDKTRIERVELVVLADEILLERSPRRGCILPHGTPRLHLPQKGRRR